MTVLPFQVQKWLYHSNGQSEWVTYGRYPTLAAAQFALEQLSPEHSPRVFCDPKDVATAICAAQLTTNHSRYGQVLGAKAKSHQTDF